ncbi:eukaryotic translation initiation factor 4E type 1B isoform X2 [Vidua chalybeata]|nr:eukaryotic translation initiation factor 4E type 1B isoform X2 [Vidua chalybeata]
MATGEQVGARPVGWGGCRTQRALPALGVPSVGGSWGAAGSLLGWSWGSSGLSHFPLQRQQERRRQRARQQELLPAEILGKHPLQNRWALWFFKNDKSKMWQANLRLVTKFSTVEDFWALYSHIQLASKLTPGCDYSLFKDGIEPMWEDSQNKRGGRWLITLAKQQRHSELDRFWLDTLLCLIGEMFDEYSDEVCGAVINIRTKGDKIAIWTREAENQEGVTHIGRVYKEHLGLSQKVAIGYQAHADTATKSGSLAKTKFVV